MEWIQVALQVVWFCPQQWGQTAAKRGVRFPIEKRVKLSKKMEERVSSRSFSREDSEEQRIHPSVKRPKPPITYRLK